MEPRYGCDGRAGRQSLRGSPDDLVEMKRRADIDDETKRGTTSWESADLREARRRIKLLEQENKVMRRAAAYVSQAHLPGKGSTRS